jgi:hypothetical protein
MTSPPTALKAWLQIVGMAVGLAITVFGLIGAGLMAFMRDKAVSESRVVDLIRNEKLPEQIAQETDKVRAEYKAADDVIGVKLDHVTKRIDEVVELERAGREDIRALLRMVDGVQPQRSAGRQR